MCMLLPAVVFSSYRRQGEKVLIPTGSHGWEPSEARSSSLSARSAGEEWMEPGCADPSAPTTCHWDGLTVLWGPLCQKLHGKSAAWSQRSFLWPWGSCLWSSNFAASPCAAVWSQGWLLPSRTSCWCLIIIDFSVVLIRNGWLKMG